MQQSFLEYFCEECGFANDPAASHCGSCQHPFPSERSETQISSEDAQRLLALLVAWFGYGRASLRDLCFLVAYLYWCTVLSKQLVQSHARFPWLAGSYAFSSPCVLRHALLV